VAVSIIPSVYFFYPETTALSVEEIDKIFIDAPNIWSIVGLAESRRREKKARGGLEGAGEIEDFEAAKRKEEQLEQALAETREPKVHHT
jgi:hypothetical protein